MNFVRSASQWWVRSEQLLKMRRSRGGVPTAAEPAFTQAKEWGYSDVQIAAAWGLVRKIEVRKLTLPARLQAC